MQIAEGLRDGGLQAVSFGMGCFWGPDSRFGALDGVVQTRVGYAGATYEEPTYRDMPGHAEVVRVTFDPRVLSFETLFDEFRRWYTPTKAFGSKYRPAVFTTQSAHSDVVSAFAGAIEDITLRPQTAVSPEESARFWSAEDYHQKWRLRKANPPLAATLEAEFGSRWDESELATKLNGLEKHELDPERFELPAGLVQPVC
jgi:peptide-methionine (S)-S-oxide reductase